MMWPFQWPELETDEEVEPMTLFGKATRIIPVITEPIPSLNHIPLRTNQSLVFADIILEFDAVLLLIAYFPCIFSTMHNCCSHTIASFLYSPVCTSPDWV